MASFANRSIGLGSSPRNGNALPEVGSLVYGEWERKQRHYGAFEGGLQKENGCVGPVCWGLGTTTQLLLTSRCGQWVVVSEIASGSECITIWTIHGFAIKDHLAMG